MKRRASLVWMMAAVLVVACSKPKPPQLTPRSAQLSAVLPDGVELALLIDAQNPNPFPIVASRVTGVFELPDGTELGRGESSEAFTLPSEGSAALSAKLKVRWNSLAALAPYAMAAKPLPYRLRGSARIGGERLNVDVPFSIDGQLTPEQVVSAGLRGAGSLLQPR
jgi:LEA14-like dessication related protein